MKYKISHTTRYEYEEDASLSHNELFLIPRNTLNQNCIENILTLSPSTSAMSQRKDYFGNTVTTTTIQTLHKILEISAVSKVDLFPDKSIIPDQTPAWDEVKKILALHPKTDDLDAFQFVFASPLIPVKDKFAEWVRELFAPGTPILTAALNLTQKIFTAFTYDPQATTTATPVETAFDIKKGVCQDFAHIEIACLRSLGLSARYVSGYLHTLPAPGKPKLTGADASHAWLSLYIPGTGWVDLDPTNNVIPSDQHLTLAWGRDYSDVTPVKGTVLGGGKHRLTVTVDVTLL